MQYPLNPEQLDGVTSINGPTMILAGAGTGKTRVITYRIAHLLNNGVNPKEIVALTFTNKAAREMRDRLSDLVGASSKGVFCGTFHSYCLFLLRKYYSHVGLDRGFHIINTADQIDLVKKTLEHEGWVGLYRAEDLHARISNAKNRLLSPNDLVNRNFNDQKYNESDPDLIARVYRLYERQLIVNRVIDFDDCIFKIATILDSNLELRDEIRHHISYLLVDEFQDTNFAQLKIINQLAGGHQRICVVGDDDQSIYSWRGAMAETINMFEQMFDAVKVIKLEQNYRCSNVILNAANSVIKNNSQRKSKTLWSKSQSNDPIVVASFEDETSEARWISQKVYTFLGRGVPANEISILFRTNGQARALEEALREHKIEYNLVGGTSFFDRKEVRDFLAYVRLISNPEDRLALFRAINTPARGVGLKTLESIDAISSQNSETPFQVLCKNMVPLKGSIKTEINGFITEILRFKSIELKTPEDLELLGRNIIKDFKLDGEIRDKVSDHNQRLWKLELLHKLPVWLRKLAENSVKGGDTLDITSILDKLTLTDDRDRTDENQQKISLMTIHAAKGLEWPVVFLCGTEEDLLPHKNSLDKEETIAEERRLMYVAMTRAKTFLHLSHCRERSVGFQKQERKPSRFLEEVPTDSITRIDSDSILPPSQQKDAALRKLDMLKNKIRLGFQSNIN